MDRPEDIPNPFTDVPEGSYFHDPVIWAVLEEITQGTTPTTFSPHTRCSRAQVVTFIWRAAGRPEPTITENPFVDVGENTYFYKAVLWAVEKGITKGTTATTFSPFDTITRGQAVTFLYRAFGTKTEIANPFRDVYPGTYCYDAILWAYANGVSLGSTTTLFSPNVSCTRAQILTFMYRIYQMRSAKK